MVTSPTGRGVIVMGGMKILKNSKEMFELSASMQWTRLEQTLDFGHEYPVAIPIPDKLVRRIIRPILKRRKLEHK